MGCAYGRTEPMSRGDLMRATARTPEELAEVEALIEKRSKWSRIGNRDWPPVDFDEMKGDHAAWICGPGVPDELMCRHCDVFASVLCDGPIGDGKTCDIPLCREHRFPIGADLDLCPIHATEWQVETGGAGVVVLERLR